MIRLLCAGLLLALVPARVSAQSVVQPNQTVTNTITWTLGASTTCSDSVDGTQAGCLSIGVQNMSYVSVDLTYSATPAFSGGVITFEGDDGTRTWSKELGRIFVLNRTAKENFTAIDVHGLRSFRVKLLTTTAGTGTVSVNVQAGSSDANTRIVNNNNSALTSTALGGAAVYTSPWFDTRLENTNYVRAQAFANVASATSGFQIHCSADPSDTNFTQVCAANSAAASTLTNVTGVVLARYYRIQYTNGAGAQSSFKLILEPLFYQPSTITNGQVQAVELWQNMTRTRVGYRATAVAAGTSGTETLFTLTKSSGVAATSTATTYAPTSGKRFRITSIIFATRGHNTATAQVTTFNIRVNTAGACIVSSTPIIVSARSATPAVANDWDRVTATIPDGLDLVGDGTMQFCVSAAATYTTNAPTWDVWLEGYEYTTP